MRRRSRLPAVLAAAFLATSLRAEIRHEPGQASALYQAYLDHLLDADPLGLEKAASLDEKSSFLAYEQALDALERGDRARMVEFATKAVQLDDANGEAHGLLGRALFQMLDQRLGKSEDLLNAIAHGTRAIDLGVDDPALFDRVATAQGVLAGRARADKDVAEGMARRREQRRVLQAWADRTHDERAWQRLAELGRETDDAVLEEKALRALLRTEDRTILLLQRLAETCQSLGRCEEAIPLLEEAAASPEIDSYSEISVRVKLGECALQVGPARDARKAFERVLALDPTNRIAARGLAAALWLEGHRAEATAAMDKVMSDEGERHRLEDELTRANWLIEHDLPGGVEQARDAVKTASAGSKREQAAAQSILSDALLATGDAPGAMAAARAGLALDPANERCLVSLVDALASTGARKDAVAEIAAIEKKTTPTPSWLQRVATWEAGQALDADARRHVLRALEGLEATSGPSAIARATVADVLLRTGDPAGAEQQLRSALELTPDDPDILFDLAEAIAAQGREADAVALLPDADGADEYLLFRLAGWHSAHRRGESGVALAKRARARVSESAHQAKLARFEGLVAGTLLASGQASEAADWFDKSLSRDALQPPERWLGASTALERAGRVADALALTDRALAQWPDQASLALQRARLLVKSGRVQEGGVAADAMLAAPSVPPARHASAALALSDVGATAEARRIMDRILQRFPEHAGLWLASGRLREQQGDLEGSEADLRRGIALDGTSPSALNALGYFLAEHDRSPDEAVKLLRKAVEARPHEAAYLDSLGWALFRAGRLDEGARMLESAVAHERDPVIVMHLATLRERQARGAEALTLYREALGSGLTEDLPRVEGRVKELAASLEPRP